MSDNTIHHVFVINLQRRPERLAHFKKECEREQIPSEYVHVWRAVDAISHTLTFDELQLFKDSDLDSNSETGRGCMANQLSHLQILEEIVSKKLGVCLVFQDDVKFGTGFWNKVNTISTEMRMNNMDLVWIGLHRIGAGSYFEDFDLDESRQDKIELFTSMVTDHIGHLKPSVNPASLAYVITEKGAENYLRHIKQFGIHNATDINFRNYLLSLNQFYGAFPVLCTGNSEFKSDIFKFDENALTRDMLELLENL